MLAIVRFHDVADDFPTQARSALAVLREQQGFIRGHIGRAIDEPSWWVLVTEWRNVGSYRRGLSAFQVKMVAHPVLYQALDEASAYEVLTFADGNGMSEQPSAAQAGGATHDGSG